MAIPKEILSVKRPLNSIVYSYGKNNDKYGVRSRNGHKTVNGKCIPINGAVIGYIINKQFVPRTAKVGTSFEMKEWANYELCDRLLKPLLSDLYNFFDIEDALKIYCISIIRVCNPGISNNAIGKAFDSSYLSEVYPDVALSKNTISTFLNNLGKTRSKCDQFMQYRASQIKCDAKILIDGTLKTNDSTINTLSEYSRKAKIKGRRDISVLWAYDYTNKKLICSQCYPGNMLDRTAYKDFLSNNNLTSGIIVSDKGIPASAAEDWFNNHEELHYFYPLKRNASQISNNNMLSFSQPLQNYDGILCKKVKLPGSNKYLYSFRDTKLAQAEEYTYVERCKRAKNINEEKYEKRLKEFGTIVFESDLDLTCEEAYDLYSSRWEIEVIVRYYKHACELDDVRVHDDYSLYGSEFCDFIASVCTVSLMNEFNSKNLLEKKTYKELMNILEGCKRIKHENKWSLRRVLEYELKILETLNISSLDINIDNNQKILIPENK